MVEAEDLVIEIGEGWRVKGEEVFYYRLSYSVVIWNFICEIHGHFDYSHFTNGLTEQIFLPGAVYILFRRPPNMPSKLLPYNRR